MITARPPVSTRQATDQDRLVAPRRALGVAAGALVVGIVAAVDPGGQAPFGPMKWAVATTGTFLLAAAVAARRPLRIARIPTMLLAAFTAWTAVTAAIGLDPLYAWIGTPERHAGVLAWVLCLLAFVVAQSLGGGERRALAVGAAMAAGLAGAWAGAELLGWEPIRLTGVTDRPGGPFGSSAYLGAAMALLAPAAWGVALDRATGPHLRRLAATSAALATIALMASGARAAWVGAAVGGGLLLLRRGRVRVLLPAAALVLAVAAATGVADRLPDLVTDDRGGAQGRLDEWRVATRVIADHPIAGVGPEGYRIAFESAVDERYEQEHGRHPLPDRAHSAVLDVAATTGIPGAALYLALLGVLGGAALRAMRRADHMAAGVGAGVLAYVAQSLFLFPIPELDIVAWLLAGTIVIRDRALRRRAAGVAVLGALAVLAAVAGVLDIAADRAAARGDAHAARLRPDSLRYRLVAGDVHGALRLSPRDPIARREQARLLLERARDTRHPTDIDVARAALETLARDDPDNGEVQLRLGLARALDGDDAGAAAAWRRAEHLAPHSSAPSTNLRILSERDDGTR